MKPENKSNCNTNLEIASEHILEVTQSQYFSSYTSLSSRALISVSDMCNQHRRIF